MPACRKSATQRNNQLRSGILKLNFQFIHFEAFLISLRSAVLFVLGSIPSSDAFVPICSINGCRISMYKTNGSDQITTPAHSLMSFSSCRLWYKNKFKKKKKTTRKLTTFCFTRSASDGRRRNSGGRLERGVSSILFPTNLIRDLTIYRSPALDIRERRLGRGWKSALRRCW